MRGLGEIDYVGRELPLLGRYFLPRETLMLTTPPYWLGGSFPSWENLAEAPYTA